jgi:dTDP-4-amino-4,6-dideoxygalactose transaminase
MIEPFNEPVYVTRPFLPPLSEFTARLTEIWENKWLTNYGPVEQRFEEALSQLIQ